MPLISDGLPGCPYRMTLYDRAEVADVDPPYGLQLHHPRFLEYVGDVYVMKMLYICCRPYTGRLFITSRWCVEIFCWFQTCCPWCLLLFYVISFCVCSWGGGGGVPSLWRVGGHSFVARGSPDGLLVWDDSAN